MAKRKGRLPQGFDRFGRWLPALKKQEELERERQRLEREYGVRIGKPELTPVDVNADRRPIPADATAEELREAIRARDYAIGHRRRSESIEQESRDREKARADVG